MYFLLCKKYWNKNLDFLHKGVENLKIEEWCVVDKFADISEECPFRLC